MILKNEKIKVNLRNQMNQSSDNGSQSWIYKIVDCQKNKKIAQINNKEYKI